MKKTKILIMALITILMLSTVVNAKEITNVKISLNGKPLDIPKDYGAPFIDNQSRTMIPLRIISERLGHKVEWDQSTRTASIDNQVFITIGKNVVKTPKGDVVMDTKAVLKDTRTYVPLRFVVEALDYEVKYDGPKASNGYNHMVDIFKEGMTTPTEPTEPVKEGNIYKIQTETGVVEVNLDTDLKEEFGVKMGLADDKAIELMKPFHRSMKLTETSDSIKITFYQPELPNNVGLKYNGIIELVTKDGRYLDIYNTNGSGTYAKLRDDGYIEVNFSDFGDTKPADVEYIIFSSKVDYNGRTSLHYKTELRMGVEAIGQNEFLLDKIEQMKK